MRSATKVTTAFTALAVVSGCSAHVEDIDTGQISQEARKADRGTGGGGERGGPKGGATVDIEMVAMNSEVVEVQQVDFGVDGGLSAWGALVVDPVAAARHAGFTQGYISARTNEGWVAHNVPIQSQPEADWPDSVARQGHRAPSFVPRVRTYFNIGTIDPVRTLDLVVVFSNVPLTTERDLRAVKKAKPTPFVVATAQQSLAKGFQAPPPDGLPPPPPEPPPYLAPEPHDPGLGVQKWAMTAQPSDQNVNSAFNQCVPMAYANALQYLDDTFGLNVPHDHVRGYGGDDSLVGQLDDAMQRTASFWCNGGGTFLCVDDDDPTGMIDGFYQYLADNGLTNSVLLEHQGVAFDFPGGCPQLMLDDPYSPSAGDVVTIDWVKSHIDYGSAVVLAFERLAPNTESFQSGHMIRIYGYSEANGQTFFYALDDQAQDSMQNGMCQPNPAGLTWEPFAVGDSDNDGTLNKGLNNLREITFAMAIGVQ